MGTDRTYPLRQPSRSSIPILSTIKDSTVNAMFPARTVAPDFRLVETLSLGVIACAANWSPAA